MSNVVIVVDMLRGFLEEGYPLYCGPAARTIIPNVAALIADEKEKGSAIIFIADNHLPDDQEFKMFPSHCVTGTIEAEVIPELRQFITDAPITKQRYSGFFGTTLGDSLKKLGPDRIIVSGVCTDICVLHTVADARNRDYPVEIPVNCVASFDEEAHRWALKHMEKVLGAKLTHTKE